MRPHQIPTAQDWAGFEADLDVRDAHRLLFGRAASEVLEHFGGGRGIERTSEFLYMPRRAFQYYIFAFADFLRSDKAAGQSDDASPFLHLLLEREKLDPGSVAEIYTELEPTVEFVASNQAYFDANPEIYGSFPYLAMQLKAICALRA